MPTPFRRLLVANRGEIAVRVIRACREMGIESVAVFSEADRDGLHVRLADRAYPIGPPAPAQSYLRIEGILDAARRSGAEAIHPGYGFLSENPVFAEACEAAGVVFIGPPASAMKAMGNKIEARRVMKAAGVPVIPGSDGGVGSEAEIRKVAGRVGYPILIKAASGGGGRGMRVVRSAKEIGPALDACRSEAGASFGDDTVYVERYSDRVRHIEVQVLADGRGNVVHLGERECSIQRRHQKLIEESPSPLLDAAARASIGEAAVKACKAIGYRSAGTVEFLADDEGEFHFMEVNARLQVEHPVTELVTGVDLVKEQFRIAAGEALGLDQADIGLSGSAIECRIIAEDPEQGFLPTPGRIERLRVPGGPGVRDDSGVYEGYTMPIHYDSLISKLITWGGDREEAIDRMRRALDEYFIEGFPTTIGFLRRVMDHPEFLAGRLHTRFVESMNGGPPDRARDGDAVTDMAAIAAALAST
ncbi:MAG TPA: acetyl-CoA carboxylase biotin carboxylase subunit, partial [Candidatus Saccharimonadales bacterium]|nr:acetyl-CoA carboxylase biotin carboxylase subunit [Candidatus Saccharimonadales bacterium]